MAMEKRPVIIRGKSKSKWPRNASGTANCSIEGRVSQSPVHAGKTMAITIVMLRAICRLAWDGPCNSCVATAI